MSRGPASIPRLIPRPCFCGCGGVACYGEASGPRYLPGHAPGERAPDTPAPRPAPIQAGAPAAVPPGAAQPDLFGPPAVGAGFRPRSKQLTS